jgi:hypothetical protein
MKYKWLVAGVLITVLLLVCLAAAAIMFFSINRGQMNSGDVDWRIFQDDRFSAEEDQDWSFSADGPMELVIDSSAGDVEDWRPGK